MAAFAGAPHALDQISCACADLLAGEPGGGADHAAAVTDRRKGQFALQIDDARCGFPKPAGA
ncbi:MAG: hypothetical protein COV75_04515 [Candidatus Omnitrophica bacterium CG11_big_fil_rev_8_21_14_0_20_63_9]|nr:MAG: hypothetical protein COV75_04515 [Candidatus Omnitrophica bacterium CG11_big_fil_rev_8_21_14_0_20_63_9]